MRILFLESFFGGSHKDFAQAVKKHSHHEITLLTLPARHWKWRQGGSALAFCALMEERKERFNDYDRLVVTDLTDLNLLKSLHPLPPVLLYMHESQFHYPLGKGEEVDFHYGLKDFTNMLAADEVVFNSRYHGETFFSECAAFLSRMPDCRPTTYLNRLKNKWRFVYPGFTPPENQPVRRKKDHGDAPVILWNHRWEHDKNPEDFHRFLRNLKERNQPFRLILLGERFRQYPEAFDRIKEEFARDILTSDYAESRRAYWEALFQADFAVSTSLQENFGISVVESIYAGATPLLPHRLSYPEILPVSHHQYLYDSPEDLTDKLIAQAHRPTPSEELARSMSVYTHENTVARLDQILENMA